MTTDLDELERLHREATGGEWAWRTHPEYGWVVDSYQLFNVANGKRNDADAAFIAASHNAMPALIAELRGKRNDVANLEEMLATLNGQVSEMLAFLGVDTSVETGVPGDTWALRDALIAREAELRALREVAEVAKSRFVPTCNEAVSSSEHPTEGDPLICGEVATHTDRMNGYNVGFLCDAHAETSLASARKAASKGHRRALMDDVPHPLPQDVAVTDLRAALAKVPR